MCHIVSEKEKSSISLIYGRKIPRTDLTRIKNPVKDEKKLIKGKWSALEGCHIYGGLERKKIFYKKRWGVKVGRVICGRVKERWMRERGQTNTHIHTDILNVQIACLRDNGYFFPHSESGSKRAFTICY